MDSSVRALRTLLIKEIKFFQRLRINSAFGRIVSCGV